MSLFTALLCSVAAGHSGQWGTVAVAKTYVPYFYVIVDGERLIKSLYFAAVVLEQHFLLRKAYCIASPLSY